ncbi:MULTISPECIES: ATPase [Actinomyces]|uniref:ATPase n=1 Tax=Actinomyces respiraculi TaxID=2744574 RepID=A0A7T0PVQ8_9ACTO|nr:MULTISPECIES: ATPase [Actinomyces]QPL04688.1 ATPase [Actinomyces respiraculi]
MTTPGHDAGDDLLRILDELDTLIAAARSMPMSASAIVNREEALDLIDRARSAVPSAVRRAEEIVADAGAVLDRGREESERIVLRAQEEAERLVAGETVVRLANDRADAIIAAAEERATALRHGADDYCDRTLAALEVELGKVADQVRAGREVLAGRLAHADAAQRWAQSVEAGAEGAERRRAGWSVDPTTAPQH